MDRQQEVLGGRAKALDRHETLGLLSGSIWIVLGVPQVKARDHHHWSPLQSVATIRYTPLNLCVLLRIGSQLSPPFVSHGVGEP